METEKVEKMETEMSRFTVGLQSVEIMDGRSFEASGEQLVGIKDWRKKINDLFDDPINAANQAHKKLCALKRKFTDVLDISTRSIEGKRSAWRMEQQRLADAKARIVQEQLRKDAEDAQIAEALRLEESGDHQGAKAIVEEEISVPAVIVQPETPKTDGLSLRRNWKARVVNANLVPREYLIVDEKALGAVARGLKEKAKVSGVEFYFEETESRTR